MPRNALFRNVEGHLHERQPRLRRRPLDARQRLCRRRPQRRRLHRSLRDRRRIRRAALERRPRPLQRGRTRRGDHRLRLAHGRRRRRRQRRRPPRRLRRPATPTRTRTIPGSEAGFPNNYLGVRDLLYLNLGNDRHGHARFREVGEKLGIDTRVEHGLGAVFTDVNGDGRLDLYVANDANPNRLYVNVPAQGRPRLPTRGGGGERRARRPERGHGHRRRRLQRRRAAGHPRHELAQAAARRLPVQPAGRRLRLLLRRAGRHRARLRHVARRLGRLAGSTSTTTATSTS